MKNWLPQSRRRAITVLTIVGALPTAGLTAQTHADTVLQLKEITVTARKVHENVQSVPDSITVFTAAKIRDSGIKTIDDFATLTPNLSFHSGDAYEPGTFDLTMRGIGQTVGGWPAVAFLVDGVPMASTDAMQMGSLMDIERIEVLRGPQSALYGFNAIAGAINIVTTPPTNAWHYAADLIYGSGQDRQVSGVVSGPIIPDIVRFRVDASYRDFGGLIKSGSTGAPLDFQRWYQTSGKLVFTPTDDLELDLLASWDHENDGATYEDKVPGPAYVDNFSSAYDVRLAYPGYVDRNLYTVATHLDWKFDHFSIIATVGFNHTEHVNDSGACYDDPNDPLLPAPDGGAQCLLGNAYGNAAPPGQPSNEFTYEYAVGKTLTSDVRLASRGSSVVDWTLGVSTLHRDFLGGFNLGDILAPDNQYQTVYPSWGTETDRWWGIYGQAIWHITRRWDLTAAARYDDESYDDVAYMDDTFSTVLPVYTPAGALANSQHETADGFQPKGQLSYHFTQDDMGYITVSRGFRAGFFLYNLYTLPEHTTNYEMGYKSALWNRRIIANASVFYIDYANQQFYQNIATPPYVISTNIPKTAIKGAELESTVLASHFLTFGGSVGYLDTEVANGGGWSPGTPRFNLTSYVDLTVPVARDWSARVHIDDRYNSREYLGQGNTDENPAKNFVNARAGIQNGRWEIDAFVRNATDRREQTQAGSEAAGGYIRYENEPRSYGIEIRASL